MDDVEANHSCQEEHDMGMNKIWANKIQSEVK